MRARPKPPRLSADNKIIIRQTGNDHMSSALTCAIAAEIAKEDARYSWKGTIKPSQLSLTMCLEEFQKKVDVYRKWGLQQKMVFLYGNAIHHWVGRYIALNF